MKRITLKNAILTATMTMSLIGSMYAQNKLEVIRSSMSSVQVRLSAEEIVAGVQMRVHGSNARFSAPVAIGSISQAGWIFAFNQVNDSTINIIIMGGSNRQNIDAGVSSLVEIAVDVDPSGMNDSTTVWVSDVVMINTALDYMNFSTTAASWTNVPMVASGTFSAEKGSLAPNYPNPFNPSTKLAYRINEAGQVRLAVYDILGREVKVIVDGFKQAGEYGATWNSDSYTGGMLPSGTYFAVLTVDGSRSIQKMVLKK